MGSGSSVLIRIELGQLELIVVSSSQLKFPAILFSSLDSIRVS